MKDYRIRIHRRLRPWYRVFRVYRHEVEIAARRLVLFIPDGSVLSLPMDSYTWKLYPEVWQFQDEWNKTKVEA